MREDASVDTDVVADANGAAETAQSPPAGHGTASALPPLAGDATARSATHTRAVRAWTRYLVALTVIVALIAGCAALLWERGEYRHAHDHPATIAAKELPRAALAPTLTGAWHSADHAVLGDAVTKDVAVTYGGRTVTGRDARTGAARWTYTRTDRRLCSAVVQEAVVMAIYAHDGICDEATGLDATTGKRTWTRTLLGEGSSLTVTGNQGYYLLVRPGSVNLVHAGQGLAGIDDWNDILEAGCRTRSAVLGNSGVLIRSSCPGGDKIIYRKLDGDKRAWTIPAAGRTPVAADSVLTVLSADGRAMEALSAKKGAVSSRVPLRTPAPPAVQPRADQLSDVATEIVAVAGGAVGLSTADAPVVRWQVPAGLLNVTVDDGVLTARTGSVYSVATDSGRQRKVSSVAGLDAGARLWSMGGGLLADSASGVTGYR